MDFIDQIRELGERALDLKGALARPKRRQKTLLLCHLFDYWDMMFLIHVRWFLNTLLILAPKRAKRLIMLFSKTDPLHFI